MIKTYKRAATFVHVATSDDQSENRIILPIASGSAPTNDFYFVGQIRRSNGVDITNGFDFVYTSGTGYMTISGSTAINEGDVVTIMGAWTN